MPGMPRAVAAKRLLRESTVQTWPARTTQPARQVHRDASHSSRCIAASSRDRSRAARNNSGTTIGRQAQGSLDSGVEVAALAIPRFRPDRKIYELDARSLYSQRQRERPLRHASGYIWLLQRSRFYVDTQTASHMITFVNEFRKMHFTATRVSV